MGSRTVCLPIICGQYAGPFINLSSHLIILQALLGFWGGKYEVRTGISAWAGGESIGLTKEELLDSIFEVLWILFGPCGGGLKERIEWV